MQIIIFVALLALAALFAIIETAFSSVSKNKILVAKERGDSRAESASYVLENFERAITTLLICTNIVHITAAAVVTAFVTSMWGLGAVSISTIITTIIVFFAGEMLPKSFAKKSPTGICLSTAGLLKLLMKVFYPLSTLLSMLGKKVAEHTSGDPEVSVTEDELKDIIEDMAEEGTIDEEQEDLISSVLEFSDSDAKGIMTPMKDVVSIDVDMPDEEVFAFIKDATHSRLPVYEGGPGNIIGILQIRKYMRAYLKERKYPEIKPLLDEVFYARVGTNADDLLEMMSEQKMNIAVINNRNGKNLGIVTIEDILEEIVGEIWDENDNDVPDSEQEGGAL